MFPSTHHSVSTCLFMESASPRRFAGRTHPRMGGGVMRDGGQPRVVIWVRFSEHGSVNSGRTSSVNMQTIWDVQRITAFCTVAL